MILELQTRDRELIAMGEPTRVRLRDAAERRLNDALSHAMLGHPDAARQRIAEATDMLAAEVRSLRAKAFRSSFRWWAGRHDYDTVRPGLPAEPPEGWTSLIQVMPLHGATPDRLALAVADGLRHHLASAMASGNLDSLLSWRLRAMDVLGRAIDSSVSDATALADQAAGRWTARPDLLEPHPSIPDPP